MIELLCLLQSEARLQEDLTYLEKSLGLISLVHAFALEYQDSGSNFNSFLNMTYDDVDALLSGFYDLVRLLLELHDHFDLCNLYAL